MKCGKCGSSQMIRDVKVLDEYQYSSTTDLRLEVQADPDAMIFKERERVPVVAHVCGKCGFTELYAAEPERLWEAAQRAGRT
jgi:predicted nucleic-acid-binding Zn-ribbon protein